MGKIILATDASRRVFRATRPRITGQEKGRQAVRPQRGRHNAVSRFLQLSLVRYLIPLEYQRFSRDIPRNNCADSCRAQSTVFAGESTKRFSLARFVECFRDAEKHRRTAIFRKKKEKILLPVLLFLSDAGQGREHEVRTVGCT